MSNPNLFPSEKAIVGGVIDPVVQSAGTVTTAWIDMGLFEQVLAVLQTGTMVANSVVNAKLRQATDASGTGVKDIAGKAITPLTAADSDDDKQAKINCRSDELDVNNGFAFVQLSIAVTVADSAIAAVLYAFEARYQPGTDSGDELASVDETVK